ncbi:hypothetical protein K488DRAFT_91767 [Vararia minispora EC-137]|uniref:Uncharacterized protein n=1 Tax=Vararia minispora EC-137 TaxID=1314806 RepID=A0ACB8Q5J6_9AGAM|nr:hypothetical protein K488DRAFT_91767 [Vararia minispora EC-137]
MLALIFASVMNIAPFLPPLFDLLRPLNVVSDWHGISASLNPTHPVSAVTFLPGCAVPGPFDEIVDTPPGPFCLNATHDIDADGTVTLSLTSVVLQTPVLPRPGLVSPRQLDTTTFRSGPFSTLDASARAALSATAVNRPSTLELGHAAVPREDASSYDNQTHDATTAALPHTSLPTPTASTNVSAPDRPQYPSFRAFKHRILGLDGMQEMSRAGPVSVSRRSRLSDTAANGAHASDSVPGTHEDVSPVSIISPGTDGGEQVRLALAPPLSLPVLFIVAAIVVSAALNVTLLRNMQTRFELSQVASARESVETRLALDGMKELSCRGFQVAVGAQKCLATQIDEIVQAQNELRDTSSSILQGIGAFAKSQESAAEKTANLVKGLEDMKAFMNLTREGLQNDVQSHACLLSGVEATVKGLVSELAKMKSLVEAQDKSTSAALKSLESLPKEIDGKLEKSREVSACHTRQAIRETVAPLMASVADISAKVALEDTVASLSGRIEQQYMTVAKSQARHEMQATGIDMKMDRHYTEMGLALAGISQAQKQDMDNFAAIAKTLQNVERLQATSASSLKKKAEDRITTASERVPQFNFRFDDSSYRWAAWNAEPESVAVVEQEKLSAQATIHTVALPPTPTKDDAQSAIGERTRMEAVASDIPAAAAEKFDVSSLDVGRAAGRQYAELRAPTPGLGDMSAAELQTMETRPNTPAAAEPQPEPLSFTSVPLEMPQPSRPLSSEFLLDRGDDDPSESDSVPFSFSFSPSSLMPRVWPVAADGKVDFPVPVDPHAAAAGNAVPSAAVVAPSMFKFSITTPTAAWAPTFFTQTETDVKEARMIRPLPRAKQAAQSSKVHSLPTAESTIPKTGISSPPVSSFLSDSASVPSAADACEPVACTESSDTPPQDPNVGRKEFGANHDRNVKKRQRQKQRKLEEQRAKAAVAADAQGVAASTELAPPASDYTAPASGSLSTSLSSDTSPSAPEPGPLTARAAV